MGWTHDPRMAKLGDGYVRAYYTVMCMLEIFHNKKFPHFENSGIVVFLYLEVIGVF